MTKSIITERRKSEKTELTYDQQLTKFLGEFGMKDSRKISEYRHKVLMESHFYWVDKEDNQGYYIPDDIESKRDIKDSETGIYEHLYFDAVSY